jgi:unsaturated chondroitin disaccharide hydrolase
LNGELWLGYEHSKNKELLNVANIQIDSFLERIEKKIDVNHHDMGFLYTPSCVAGISLITIKTVIRLPYLQLIILLKDSRKKVNFYKPGEI